MNPVFQREMRARARTAGPWWMRVWMAFAAGGVFALLSGAEALLGSGGRDAFFILNGTATLLLGGAGVWLTHDLVCRERREGTLGLLMMSPLTPGQVLAGKVSLAVLQGFSAWLAMFPVLVLPVLSGGVEAGDVLAMACMQATTLGVSLASGLVASAWSESPGWSLFAGLGILMAVGFVVVLPAVVSLSVHAGGWAVIVITPWLGAAVVAGLMKMAAVELDDSWAAEREGGPVRKTPGMPAGPSTEEPTPEAAEPPASSPYAQVPTPTVPGWVERRLTARRRRLLESDALGWLLERRRNPMWMVPVAMAGVYGWWLTTAGESGAPRWPEWVMPMLMSASMAGWLREERENGMLEVLMTTPCAGRLERTLCRRMWVENGTWVLLHGLLTGMTAPFMEGGTRWAFLPLASAAWASPWIGLLVHRRLGGWWARAVMSWVLLQKLPWLLSHGLAELAKAWVGDQPWRYQETPGAFMVQGAWVLAMGWAARAWLRGRLGKGGKRHGNRPVA